EVSKTRIPRTTEGQVSRNQIRHLRHVPEWVGVIGFDETHLEQLLAQTEEFQLARGVRVDRVDVYACLLLFRPRQSAEGKDPTLRTCEIPDQTLCGQYRQDLPTSLRGASYLQFLGTERQECAPRLRVFSQVADLWNDQREPWPTAAAAPGDLEVDNTGRG